MGRMAKKIKETDEAPPLPPPPVADQTPSPAALATLLAAARAEMAAVRVERDALRDVIEKLRVLATSQGRSAYLEILARV